MSDKERIIILVVKDDKVFAQMLQNFPQDTYELAFATEAAEALAISVTRCPHVIIVPTEEANKDLTEVLSEVRHEDTIILGVAPDSETKEAAERTSKIFSQVVVLVDEEDLPALVRELLADRRRNPRVNLEFPIEFGDGGSAIVREFSADALRIETEDDLREGALIVVKVGWGTSPLEFKAIVGRVQPAMFLAQNSAVLHVVEEEQEATEYLKNLVRRVSELQHLLSGDEDGTGKLRGDAAWEMARRAEETVRDSGGLVVRESGDMVIVEEGGFSRTVSSGELEHRYKLEGIVDSWGVGDVYAATHSLLNRPVMLKRLKPDLEDNEIARLRLELEARVAAAMRGEHVVDVLDFGDDGRGSLYYAMEALGGETLAAALERGLPLNALEVATLGVHLASALTKIHLRGEGHFDLCPENVFLKRPGGTTIRPILINIAGRELWGDPAKTYARGAEYRPPGASKGPPGPDCDLYALAAILNEAFEAQRDDSEKLSKLSPGTQYFAEVLRVASSSSRTERFRDADVFRHAIEKSLSVLETEAPRGQARLVEPLVVSSRTTMRPTPVPERRPTPVALFTSGPTANVLLQEAADEEELASPYDELTPSPEEMAQRQEHQAKREEHGAKTVPAPPMPEKARTSVIPEGDRCDNASVMPGPPGESPAPDREKKEERKAEKKAEKKPLSSTAAKLPKPPPKRLAPKDKLPKLPSKKKTDKKSLPKPPRKKTALKERSPKPTLRSGPAGDKLPKPPPKKRVGHDKLPKPPAKSSVVKDKLPKPPAKKPVGRSKQVTPPPFPNRPASPPPKSTVDPEELVNVLPPPVPAGDERDVETGVAWNDQKEAEATAAAGEERAGVEANLPDVPEPEQESGAAEIPADRANAPTLPPEEPAPEPPPQDQPMVAMTPAPIAPPPPSVETAPQASFPAEQIVAPTKSRKGLAIGALAFIGGLVLSVAFVWWAPWRSSDTGTTPGRVVLVPVDAAPQPQKSPEIVPPVAASKTVPAPDAGAAKQQVLPEAGPPADAAPAPEQPEPQPQPDAGPPTPEPAQPDAAPEPAELTPNEKRRNLLGKAKRRIRRSLHNEAMEYLNDAAQIRDGGDVRYLYALSHAKRGNHVQAIYNMKRATRYSPSSARYQDQLGSLYIKVGQRSKACSAFRAALKNSPNHRAAKRHISRYCN